MTIVCKIHHEFLTGALLCSRTALEIVRRERGYEPETGGETPPEFPSLFPGPRPRKWPKCKIHHTFVAGKEKYGIIDCLKWWEKPIVCELHHKFLGGTLCSTLSGPFFWPWTVFVCVFQSVRA